jgi:hypothetical protein
VVVTEPLLFHNRWFADLQLAGKMTRFGLLEIKAPGWTVMQRRGANYKRKDWKSKPILPMHLPIYYYLFQMMDQLAVTSTWAPEERTQWCDFVPMWMAHGRIAPVPFYYVDEVLRQQDAFVDQHHAPGGRMSSVSKWFVHTLEDRKAAVPRVWITGQMLVTRVLRNEEFITAMYREFYAYYHDITSNHYVDTKHHKPVRTPAGDKIPVTYLPLKQVIWVIHATAETPPTPCIWALDNYGFAPGPHQVQSVTLPLTKHDTTYPEPPEGWPLPQESWPDGFMTCFVVHFWDMKPITNTLEEMYDLK